MSCLSFYSVKKISKKLIFIICFIVVFCFVFSLSYALNSGISSTSIESNIVYIDEDAYGSLEFNSKNLELIPILDKAVANNNLNVIKINFLVGGSQKNNIDDIVYDISLTDLFVDCTLLSPYLKWRLIKNDEILSEGSLDYKFDTIKNGRIVLTPIQQDLIDYSEDKSDYDRYTFYMWLSDSCQEIDLRKCKGSEDQRYLLNKTIKGKVSVELNVGDKRQLVRSPSDTLDTNSCINEMGTDD